MFCSLNVSEAAIRCVPVNLLSDLHNNRHEGCSDMNCCDFSGVCIKLSHFRLHNFRKREILVLNNLKSESWEKETLA